MTVEPFRLRRKNRLNIVKEARKLGSFDDFPYLQPYVDPQLHVSNNTVDQPFYLRGEKDMVLAQFSGASRVIFEDGPVRYFDLDLGDYVYVPAGVGHRVLTTAPGVLIRYKAAKPGKEQMVWKCPTSGEDVFTFDWDATEEIAQEGYQKACEAFNASPRTCPDGSQLEEVDLSQFRWDRIARTIETAEVELEDTGEEEGH